MKAALARCPWFAPETFSGGPVSPATDVVGYSYTAQEVLGVMAGRYPALEALLQKGRDVDPAMRPQVKDFIEIIQMLLR